MSESARQEIADAANSVDGVNVSPYYRQTTKPGDGSVRLDRSFRAENRFGWMDTWQVLVILPQDIATAERYLDSKVDELLEALNEVIAVLSVTPSELQLDNSPKVPCVVIEGNRPH